MYEALIWQSYGMLWMKLTSKRNDIGKRCFGVDSFLSRMRERS